MPKLAQFRTIFLAEMAHLSPYRTGVPFPPIRFKWTNELKFVNLSHTKIAVGQRLYILWILGQNSTDSKTEIIGTVDIHGFS